MPSAVFALAQRPQGQSRTTMARLVLHYYTALVLRYEYPHSLESCQATTGALRAFQDWLSLHSLNLGPALTTVHYLILLGPSSSRRVPILADIPACRPTQETRFYEYSRAKQETHYARLQTLKLN